MALYQSILLSEFGFKHDPLLFHLFGRSSEFLLTYLVLLDPIAKLPDLSPHRCELFVHFADGVIELAN